MHQSPGHPLNLRLVLLCSCALVLFSLSLAPYSSAQTASEKNTSPKMPTIKTPIEKEHMPVIKAPQIVNEGELFFISIQVGETIHEMTETHHIERLEGFVNGKQLFSLTLQPTFAEPRITIPMRLYQAAVFKVEAHCSVHGTWGTELQIHTQAAVIQNGNNP